MGKGHTQNSITWLATTEVIHGKVKGIHYVGVSSTLGHMHIGEGGWCSPENHRPGGNIVQKRTKISWSPKEKLYDVHVNLHIL